MPPEPLVAQVLNRDFVLDQVAQLVRHLTGPSAVREVEAFGVTVGAGFASVEQTRSALERMLQRERASAQDPISAANDRRGAPVPLGDVAFLSHDPIVNLVQSALDEHYQTALGPMPVESHRRDIQDIEPVTDRIVPGLDLDPDRPSDRRLFNAFEPADPLWVNSAIAMGIRLARRRRDFTPRPAPPAAIAENARVVLVGDWGSGVPRAREVARHIRTELDEGKRAGREQHVVHLGDVYYSGWPREYDRRFLNYWPVTTNEAGEIGSWALNANHDMYSGGRGYFDHLLNDPRFEQQANSSYFSLSNGSWQLLGLDTGYDDGRLAGPQPQWVADQMAAHPDRKTILLSHHQAFSDHGDVGAALRGQLDGVLHHGVDAWFWGHEHRCVHYAPFDGVRHGRCIGHGGVPVYVKGDPHAALRYPVIYEQRDRIQHRDWGQFSWAVFGFAVLDFDGATVLVRYIDEFGHEHIRETIR